ncbi:SAM-dependent methyltransferase [Micromonospora craniellae]|uniref:Uncharacterized protein n=1 Tax=Micromonospora craniellae TaxID=2294034 RepID=A0A372G1P1_9ACTN|nr:SAM-dependent methyltransferase [Micromonospora craniellae]QOC91828.1 SAM-dependent methyltransferase [Micromonospora craniellae]RFS46659.1 hypothetical protein D0Q02_09435 [Micromonospora craniellae]
MVEPDQPSTARMIDFWLGGEHHYPVDVAAAHTFLDVETRVRTLDELYTAVAPGSQLAIDFDTEELAGHPQALAMMGPAFRMRAPAAFGPLLGRWTPTAEGIVPVTLWRPDGLPEAVPDAFHGAVAVRSAG